MDHAYLINVVHHCKAFTLVVQISKMGRITPLIYGGVAPHHHLPILLLTNS